MSPVKRTLYILFALTTLSLAQTGRGGGGIITGKTLDTINDRPVEYANIILFDQTDSTQITGTTSGSDGQFQLRPIPRGIYTIEVRFMGYKIESQSDIRVAGPRSRVDLGVIALQPTVLEMEGVQVQGERPALTYDIDKKVINVDRMQTAISGTATDVLENVPSINVDIEGNVSLRGSGNFQVLIDGRPSVLDANDALQQIPASSIQDIEIITNPSSKYDPDGTAGIINVVLKKNKHLGNSGLANFNGGVSDKYGGDILVEHREESFRALLGLDFNRRFYDGNEREERMTAKDDIASYIDSEGSSSRGRVSTGVRASLDLNLSPNDNLSFSARGGQGSFQHNSRTQFDTWSETLPERSRYISQETGERSGLYLSLNSSFRHQFPQKGHEWEGQIHYRYRDGDDETINKLTTLDRNTISGRKSTESGPASSLRLKFDYSRPLGQESRFEAGYQSDFRRSEEASGLLDFVPQRNTYVPLPEYEHTTHYHRNTHAVYTLYRGTIKGLGLQGGLRGEYTDRQVELAGTENVFTIDRWDLFPTAHMSYEFNEQQQFMASYTRRIDRPRGYYLEPFETWSDAYNVRKGNPGIVPEYIDSYESGYQTIVGSSLFSAELYYRMTHNKIERVRSVYDTNITLHTVENVGTDYSFGTELLFNFDVGRWWDVNLMGNLYNYRIEGELYDEVFSRESTNWSARFNNVFKLRKTTSLQINSRYNSPTVSSQGRREGRFRTDLAIRQDFFDRALSATLQVRDVFGQDKHEYTSEGPDFYTSRYYTHESPVLMLNLKLNINNYKSDRSRRGNGDDMGDEEF